MLRTWPGKRPGARSTRNPSGCGRSGPTAGCPRAGSCTPAAAPRSTPPRLAAGPSRPSSWCCARARLTRSWSAATRAAHRPRSRAGGQEGDTPLSVEAAGAFDGPVWLVTAKPESPLGELADEVVVTTPEVEKSWCHTASYTCAVAAIAALHGEEIGGLPDLVEQALHQSEPLSAHERWLVAGAGRDWPTAQEAVLKLREGAYVAAEAHHTEQLLPGHLAAVDETVRAFVLEGEGRWAERAAGAVAALRELGCDTTLVPTAHPVPDIVRFQLLTLDLAEARGVDPDKIRRDDPRWERARETYE